MIIEYVKRGECERLDDVPEGFAVDRIDGAAVIGRCGNCHKVLTDTDDVDRWREGIACRWGQCVPDPSRMQTHWRALATEWERRGTQGTDTKD